MKIHLSDYAKKHFKRFGLGLLIMVIGITFIIVAPWPVIKFTFFVITAIMLYMLGYIALEMMNEFEEIRKLDKENKAKKDKQ